MKIIVFRLSDGAIIRRVDSPDHLASKQTIDDEGWIEGEVTSENYVVNGIPVYIPPPEPAPPQPTLEEVKESKTKEIKAALNAAFFLGYTTQGLAENFKLDCRRTDLDNIRGLLEHLDGMPGDTQLEFRDFDNAKRIITIADLEIIKRELIAYGLWLYQNKWVKEAAVEAAESVEDVDAITW